MAKYKAKERPGVIIPFSAMATLEKLSDDAKGKYLWAVLNYGKYLVEPGAIHLDDPREETRLEILLQETLPKIYEDAVAWDTQVIDKSYAGYISANKGRDDPSKDRTTGQPLMTREQYTQWYLTIRARDTGNLLAISSAANATQQPLTGVDMC